jgi:hypothetical protein
MCLKNEGFWCDLRSEELVKLGNAAG